MKLVNYSKFVLLMVHLSHIVKSNRVSRSRPTATTVKGRGLKEYPYMVLVFIYVDVLEPLTPYSERACTGTLIRDDLVLTLASCLLFYYRDDPDPDVTTVMERPSRRKLHVHQIHVNPNYYSEDRYISKSHDFGILIVEKSKLTLFPQLPTRLYTFADIVDTCVMGGYGGDDGAVDIRNFKSWRMNETGGVEVVTSRACKAGGDRLCLHFGDFMPCKNGDFGSPLVCGGVLFAVNSPRFNSWQMQCLDSYIAVFIPVNKVEKWVRQIMDVPTSNLKWMSNPWYMLLLCLVVFTFMTVIYYGLVELLQKSLDPTEGAQQTEPMDLDDDEESWYESQWTMRHNE